MSMRGTRHILAYFGSILFALLFVLFGSSPLYAQDSQDSVAPNFTAQTLEDRIEIIESDSELSDEQKTQILTSLKTAGDRLAEATRQSERRAQFIAEVENTDALQAELDAELKAAQEVLGAQVEPLPDMIGDDALIELEKELREKESELSAIETRLQGLQDTLDTLGAREVSAPEELSDARAALSDLQLRLNALGDGELEAVSNARRTEIQARLWYRRNQIQSLEQEISTLASRQNLISGRRAIADVQAKILQRAVARIGSKTGETRVEEARDLRNRIAALIERSDTSHPVVAKFATENLNFANQIIQIEAEGPIVSQTTASVRGRLVDVENDLSAASKLVEQGRLDREAGETLRRLGNQLDSPAVIRADMRETQKRLSQAYRERIIAQENLRDLPLSVSDLDKFVERTSQELPPFAALSETDIATLSIIIDTRRDLLRQISTVSNTRVTTVSELRTAQSSYLEQTERLNTLLDENLVWVRSIPAINSSFPAKVGSGALNVFSPRNFNLALTELLRMCRSYFLVVLIFLSAAGLVLRLRGRLWDDVVRRSKLVGRVQQDSAWHTPVALGAGIFHSLPLALVFLLIGLLYNGSVQPDRLIQGLANGFIYLSIFTVVCGSWIRWDKEDGLFDAHFNVSDGLRQAIGSNLRWFVPFMGAASFGLAITYGMPEPEIAHGFSVFAFILTSLSLIIFSARILWAKREELYAADKSDSLFMRFRTLIAIVTIGIPLVMIGLTLTGYYESANALNVRMFVTAPLVLVTYVIHGAIRRAIVVAQRQLKYRQALERRDLELKARLQKEAAEERGEEAPPPPPVDTEKIDVTTLTQQTSKLVQTIVLLVFAGLLWMIWSSLLPALSIFDGFEVWTIKDAARDVDGAPIDRIISLWDLLQSLVILALTFIAARNFPGFLEIFVLNKLGVDAGTRYAITKVLGYVIIAAGVIIGFEQLGLQWSQLKWIATGLSVGIGFGLQKIIANFISGLIILFERPIRIGDYVTIGDQSGTVSRIKIRATTLKDLDNREILIPNEALISERVMNWTLSSSITRLIVPVGIAYGSDTDAAREIMLEAVKDLPKVLKTPAANVLFMGFGESSLDFEIRVYLSKFDERVPMTHVVHTEVNKALEAAGISIPFPQRDLNIVSEVASPVSLTVSKAKPASRSKSKPKPKKS